MIIFVCLFRPRVHVPAPPDAAPVSSSSKESLMLYAALILLSLGLVVLAWNWSEVAGIPTHISWELSVVGMVLLVMYLIKKRSSHVG